jgi:hypothetical protein
MTPMRSGTLFEHVYYVEGWDQDFMGTFEHGLHNAGAQQLVSIIRLIQRAPCYQEARRLLGAGWLGRDCQGGDTMEVNYEKPTVKLVGEDGNAFSIMARVRKALQRAKAPQEVIDAYFEEAKSGDYDHLLMTTMKYVEVE